MEKLVCPVCGSPLTLTIVKGGSVSITFDSENSFTMSDDTLVNDKFVRCAGDHRHTITEKLKDAAIEYGKGCGYN